MQLWDCDVPFNPHVAWKGKTYLIAGLRPVQDCRGGTIPPPEYIPLENIQAVRKPWLLC